VTVLSDRDGRVSVVLPPFVVIEVKLGKNGELREAVAEQLEHHVRHVRDEAVEAYARCYEKTHAQKRRFGLIAGERIPGNVRFGGWAQHQPC